MYRPYTLEQDRIYEYLQERFDLKQFLLSPLSRSGLLLEDRAGNLAAFSCTNGSVGPIPVPKPNPPEICRSFIKQFRSNPNSPRLDRFAAIDLWWLHTPNPLTYRQAIGMNDIMYRHYLAHPLISDEDVLHLMKKGVVTASEYRDLKLWYYNGHMRTCWLGEMGLDGTGNYGCLEINYKQPDARAYRFYLNDSYYRAMNDLPEPEIADDDPWPVSQTFPTSVKNTRYMLPNRK